MKLSKTSSIFVATALASSTSSTNAFLTSTTTLTTPQSGLPISRSLLTMTTRSSSIDLLQEADAIFDSIDTDQDGAITDEELRDHLCGTMGYSEDSSECRYMFDAFDSDRSGDISREELRAVFGSQNFGAVSLYMTFGLGGGTMTEGLECYNERVRKITERTHSDPESYQNKLLLDDLADMVFELIDTDRSGEIDKQELKEHFDKVTDRAGTEIQAKQYVETIFDVLDINSDGVVNREEMRDAFKQYDFRFLASTLGLPVYKKKRTA